MKSVTFSSRPRGPKCCKYQNVPMWELFWAIGKPRERFQSWVIKVYFISFPMDQTVFGSNVSLEGKKIFWNIGKVCQGQRWLTTQCWHMHLAKLANANKIGIKNKMEILRRYKLKDNSKWKSKENVLKVCQGHRWRSSVDICILLQSPSPKYIWPKPIPHSKSKWSWNIHPTVRNIGVNNVSVIQT